MQASLHQHYKSHTDEILLQLVVKQDLRAYEVLYDRHAQAVYSLLMRIVKERTVADDLLQDTFWQVWKKAAQYQGEGAVAAWLYRIARNKGLDQLRREKARPQIVDSPFDGSESFVQSASHNLRSTESEVEKIWNRQDVQLALKSLPPEQKQCLELAYFEGMSQSEIAKQTNTALGTVKTRIRIGLEKLERALRAGGYP